MGYIGCVVNELTEIFVNEFKGLSIINLYPNPVNRKTMHVVPFLTPTYIITNRVP